MLSTVFVAVVSALATVGVVNALPTEPAKPPLTYLYSANLTIPPAYDIGTVPMGGRAILPLTGGSFSGPKLSGESGVPPSAPLLPPPPPSLSCHGKAAG